MKFLTISLIALIFSQMTNAADLKICKGLSALHTITVTQAGKDVETIIDDNDFHSYRELSNAQDRKYKISGKEKSTMVLHDITLSDFIKKRSLATELVVTTIMGRPEYQGEEDMIYSYAGDFINSLKCE